MFKEGLHSPQFVFKYFPVFVSFSSFPSHFLFVCLFQHYRRNYNIYKCSGSKKLLWHFHRSHGGHQSNTNIHYKNNGIGLICNLLSLLHVTEQKNTCKYFVIFGFDQQNSCIIYNDSGEYLHICKAFYKQFTIQLVHTSNSVSVWEGSVANRKSISESTKPFRCEHSVIQNTKHSNVTVLE